MAVASGPAGPVLARSVFTLTLKIAHVQTCARCTANPVSVPMAQDIMISGINCLRTTALHLCNYTTLRWNAMRGVVGGGGGA